ncbi:MAG: alternative ribosome rescue aminoacyl-tRNA hydrolase ArfB [Phycisphaerales bacterium]
MHLAPNVWVRREDLGEQFVRASGPGGQCVNKVSSAVILRLRLDAIHGLDERRMARLRRMARRRITREGELLIKGQEFRSQRDNRRACEERLIELVHRAWDLPRQRKKTKPSRAARERRLTAKREHAQKKQRRAGKRPSADD